MNHSFDSRSDPRDRWWGIEVMFDPELDDVFGVTNNKQAATYFGNLSLDEDAASRGNVAGRVQGSAARSTNDPRLAIYEVSSEISKLLHRDPLATDRAD